jgi:hypothetical protein
MSTQIGFTKIVEGHGVTHLKKPVLHSDSLSASLAEGRWHTGLLQEISLLWHSHMR